MMHSSSTVKLHQLSLVDEELRIIEFALGKLSREDIKNVGLDTNSFLSMYEALVLHMVKL